MSKIKSGGGIQSKVVKDVGVRYGSPRREVNKVAVSMLGAQQGSHAMNQAKELNRKLEPFYGKAVPSVPLGNQVAGNVVGRAGPGAVRTVYACGTQSATPAPKPMPEGRQILSQFGPESSRPGKRI